MKIVEQSQNRLILELRPVGLMILCLFLFVLFFALGFGMQAILPFAAGMMGFPDAPGLTNLPAIPGMNLLGYASILPLLVGVFMVKTRRLDFNRAAGQITIATRGLLGRGEKTYPLATFQGASLSSSRSSDSGTTYRPVLHFSDENALVPITPYHTSGSGPARTVNAINGWLGPTLATSAAAGPAGSVILSGTDAAEAIAALEKLGIKIPR